MKWSRRIPVMAGWYWLKRSVVFTEGQEDYVSVVQIIESYPDGRLWVAGYGFLLDFASRFVSYPYAGTQWAGPLVPPDE